MTTARCLGCDGRIVNIANPGRNLSRTGSPYVCGDCCGTRRGTAWVDMRPIPADVVARFPTPQP